MAAKGTISKQKITDKIKEAFGEDYVATVDGKIYLWSKENGERLQICLSMTCPKNMVQPENAPVGATSASDDDLPWETSVSSGLDFGDGWDFGDVKPKPQSVKTNEISQEEQENIETMMKRLGLI